MAPRYRRILLKLSGEALQGPLQFGIDPTTLGAIAAEIKEIRDRGCQVGVVIGAGNIHRGVAAAARGMDRATADTMGMLATVFNSLALRDALEARGAPARVLSALEMPAVAETFRRRRALEHLDQGRVVVCAAGTGNPYFTTDTAAALRALELGTEVLLKATKVDGVYDRDPKQHADASRFDPLTYHEVLARDLAVMDATAISLCLEHRLPIVVFDLTRPGNIGRVVAGEPIGTLITEP